MSENVHQSEEQFAAGGPDGGADAGDPAGDIQLSARDRGTARARVLAGLVLGSGIVASIGIEGTPVSLARSF